MPYNSLNPDAAASPWLYMSSDTSLSQKNAENYLGITSLNTHALGVLSMYTEAMLQHAFSLSQSLIQLSTAYGIRKISPASESNMRLTNSEDTKPGRLDT